METKYLKRKKDIDIMGTGKTRKNEGENRMNEQKLETVRERERES